MSGINTLLCGPDLRPDLRNGFSEVGVVKNYVFISYHISVVQRIRGKSTDEPTFNGS